MNLGLMALTLAAAIGARADAPSPEGGNSNRKTVTLAYFADLHAQLEPHPELFWSGGRDEMTTAGGVSRLATAIEGLRRERPGRTLVFDGGDTIQGSAAAAWTEGRAVVPPVNALGLDFGIPGNWEVVYGKAALLARAEEFRHPLIAANIRDAETKELLFKPYIVRDLDGVRVAVIGLTDPDVPERQPPSYSRGLIFDGAEVLPPLIKHVREEERAEVVVVLAHIGLPKAIDLAGRLEGVDFVLSSDTHERTYQPIVKGQIWVVEPGGFGSFLGRLDVTVEGGKVVDRHWELTELRADNVSEDPGVKAVVEKTLAPLRSRLDRVIGETSVLLARYAVVETNIDAVLADALREAAGTDIGLSNGFRFAGPTPPGPIRERDLWDWYPITAPLKTGTVTGKQLRGFWERELENVFASDPAKLFGGWVPRPSGMTLRFEAKAPKGKRISEMRVGGNLVFDDARYSMVSCEREGDAPDKVCRIADVRDVRTLGFDAHEAVRRDLAAHRPLEQPKLDRVVATDLPPVVRSQVFRP